ncbi:MAG: O-antigen ligase family protein [Geobacter sp.]|nr:MAG: O-antigen ligase family protein [Geobacter sp.]
MPIALLTIFIIAYFIHVTARIPVLGAMRMDMLLGGATLVATFLLGTRDKLRLSVPTSRKLLLFLAYVVLSLPLVTWPGSVIRFNMVTWVKAAFFFLLVVGAVRTEGQLKWIMTVFLGSQTFRVLEPLYLHVKEGYWGDIAYSHVEGAMVGLNRLSGAPHDIVNANQYAWVIVSTLPFLFFLCWRGGKAGKLFFMASMPAFLYALWLTGSRSGALSLCVVAIAIAMTGPHRIRRTIYLCVLCLPVILYLFPKADIGLQNRYLSLVDVNVVGGDTRQGRLNALARQLGSISQNPLFGNGLGTSKETNVNVLGEAKTTHNLYIEVIQETGIFGFLLFAMYMITLFKGVLLAERSLREKGYRDEDWLCRLILATRVWIIMDIVYSLSCFGVSSWEWYFFGAVATVCAALVAERRDAGAPAVGDKTEEVKVPAWGTS